MKRIILRIFVCLFIVSTCYSQDYKFGDITKEALSQKRHPSEPEAPAAVLYRMSYTDFEYNKDRGFFAVIKVVERIKIYNKKGLDRATISVPLYKGYGDNDDSFTGLKAYTYELIDGDIKKTKLGKDGIFEEERSSFLDIKKFTMPNVQPGSIIEYKYTISTPYIGNLDPYYFQETIPVDRVELTFWAPEWMVYKMHRRGWYPFNIENLEKRDNIAFKKVEESRLGPKKIVYDKVAFDSKGYALELSNIPSIKEEPYMASLESYRSGIQFELNYTQFPNSPRDNYATTWSEVAKDVNQADRFGGQLKKGRLFKNLAASLVQDSDSEQEKIVKVYSFVRNTITWNGNKGIYASDDLSKIIENKTGNDADINLILVGLLREVGVGANPILISSKDNGIPIFPTRSGFDYVIAGVGEGSNPILLDAANRLSAPQVLDNELLNWSGWLIREDGTSRNVSLFPLKTANHTALVNYGIDEDLVTTGKVRSRVSGHVAQEIRHDFNGLNKDEYATTMEKNMSAIEVDNVIFKEMENPFKPLTLSYEFNSDTFVEEIGGAIYFSPLGQYATTINPFTAESRTYPIDFKFPKEDRLTLTWSIPAGYEIVSLPEGVEVNLQDGLGSYKYSISEINGQIKVSILRIINKADVRATSYNFIKEYYKLMLEKESEKVKLKKT